MRNNTYIPVQKSLNLTDDQIWNVDFHDYYHYTDWIVAIDFEGSEHLHKEYYTESEWLETNEIQRVFLTDWFTKNTRDLMCSRILRKPMSIMQSKVNDLLGFKNEESN